MLLLNFFKKSGSFINFQCVRLRMLTLFYIFSSFLKFFFRKLRTNSAFDVKSFSIFFIIFDLEAVYFYPWADSLNFFAVKQKINKFLLSIGIGEHFYFFPEFSTSEALFLKDSKIILLEQQKIILGLLRDYSGPFNEFLFKSRISTLETALAEVNEQLTAIEISLDSLIVNHMLVTQATQKNIDIINNNAEAVICFLAVVVSILILQKLNSGGKSSDSDFGSIPPSDSLVVPESLFVPIPQSVPVSPVITEISILPVDHILVVTKNILDRYLYAAFNTLEKYPVMPEVNSLKELVKLMKNLNKELSEYLILKANIYTDSFSELCHVIIGVDDVLRICIERYPMWKDITFFYTKYLNSQVSQLIDLLPPI